MKKLLTALLLFGVSVSFAQNSYTFTNGTKFSNNSNNVSISSVSYGYKIDTCSNGELDTTFFHDLYLMDSLKIEGFKDIRHDCLIRLKFRDAHELKQEIKADTIIPVKHSFIYPFFHQFVTKPVIEKEDVIIYSLQFVAGIADGVNQAVVYHGALAKYPFWNYATSWKRKYKDYDHGDLRAAFPGSKTWLVGITDGNHATRAVARLGYTASVAIAMHEHDPWYEILKEAIFSLFINRVGFSIMYDHILK